MRSVILIANYAKDDQQSMARFADMLARGLRQEGVKVAIWRPPSLVAWPCRSTQRGFRKWLGYLDKWLLAFPLLFAHSMLRRTSHYHICDHSNAPYLAALPRERKSITCHDVLAIRGALGHEDAHCPATRTGKLLQAWILRNLRSAPALATVSRETMDQLLALCGSRCNSLRWEIIPNALNGEFGEMPAAEAAALLENAGVDFVTPYLLHVGSDLPRKNRELLLHVVKSLEGRWNGRVCFAGSPLPPSMRALAERLGVSSRVAEVVRPEHRLLVALYSRCYAFVFPSLSEGFGWPVAEAQACGAPVVASSLPPMPEVAGEGALFADPLDHEEFAEALLSLGDPDRRRCMIDAGFENVQRFSTKTMSRSYASLMRI